MAIVRDEHPQTPALVLFAHHDDEFFIAATLKKMAQRGPAAAVWLTRGGLHGRLRQAESRRAMDILGVPRRALFEIGLPDNHLIDYLEDAVRRLARLMAAYRPASVIVPAFEGGHLDHDSLQLAAAAAIRRTNWGVNQHPPLYEFPLYHRSGRRLAVGEFLPGPARTIFTPLKLKDRVLKQKLARIYSSQKMILYPMLAFRGGPMMLHRRGEPYRLVSAGRNYTKPPHSGRLAYQFYTRRKFSEFASAAAMNYK